MPLQDVCAVILPQRGCMATKSRGQELCGAFDTILQLEIKSVDKVKVWSAWFASRACLAWQTTWFRQSQRIRADNCLRRHASCSPDAIKCLSVLTWCDQIMHQEDRILTKYWCDAVFVLWRCFGTKSFVAVPLPRCSLLVVNKNGGGVWCWPSVEPTEEPHA